MGALQYRWVPQQNSSPRFEVVFNRCSREPGIWKKELYAAAFAIAKKANKPLWLCISGGIDSEAMLHAFFDQGIHFSVLTLEHIAGTNRDDAMAARAWCQAHGIRFNAIPIDMQDFIVRESDVYADTYTTAHMFRILQIRLMEIVEKMDGFAIIGAGKQFYQVDQSIKHPTKKDVYINFWSGYAAPIEWCRKNDTVHEPYFFFSTPELCLAYLRIPMVAYLLENANAFRDAGNNRALRRLIYQSAWPDVKTRIPYSGFEEIQSIVSKKETQLETFLGSRPSLCRLTVDEFEKQLAVVKDGLVS